MTRGNARELAVHLIYGREFTDDPPAEVVRLRLEEGYYEQLAAEYEIYTERPTGKQVKYLEKIVTGVHAHEEELNAIIGKYSIGWDVKRISRLNRVRTAIPARMARIAITTISSTRVKPPLDLIMFIGIRSFQYLIFISVKLGCFSFLPRFFQLWHTLRPYDSTNPYCKQLCILTNIAQFSWATLSISCIGC